MSPRGYFAPKSSGIRAKENVATSTETRPALGGMLATIRRHGLPGTFCVNSFYEHIKRYLLVDEASESKNLGWIAGF